MSLRVIRIAAGSTLQDQGRPGWRRFGVPPSGAFDREAMILGNALVGNPPLTPALEIPLMGGEFEALDDLFLSVTGAEGVLHADEKALLSNSCFSLARGSILQIDAPTKGCRQYLCAAGGFSSNLVLGSASGTEIANETELVACPAGGKHRKLASTPTSLSNSEVRVLPSAESVDIRDLLREPLRVSTQSNRVGIRFQGAPALRLAERRSEPSCVGAIQATPGGELLVIGPDGPTIGGYPKVGYVIQADLDKLAQLLPGEKVQFQVVTANEAATARTQRENRLKKLVAELNASRAG